MNAKQLKKRIKAANNARSQYNPLRGMTLQRVSTLLEEGERGLYTDLQWLYRMVEKRDAVVRALKRRRSAALMKLEWNIDVTPSERMPEGVTEEMADAQAKVLRKAYEQIDNLYDAIQALALAEFRGFTHLEKVYNHNRPAPDAIVRLEPIHQWHWLRDGLNGPWLFNPELSSSIHSAEEVDAKHLIIREIDDPIDEIAAIAFLRKNMSQKDWDGFVEVFGIPDIFFEMPEGMGEDKVDDWLERTERLAGDGQGGLPAGTKVQAVGGDVRGVNPFNDHIKYQDTCVVLAGTGGKLTMLSEPTGLGAGATNAHEQAFDDLAAEEARVISGILQRSIDKPLLAAAFPDQPILARFDLCARTEEDITAIVGHIKTLSEAGFAIDAEEVSDRTGYPVHLKCEEDAEEQRGEGAKQSSIPNRQSSILNRQSSILSTLATNARDALAFAIEEDLQPIVDRLTEILDDESLSDDEFFQTLEVFQTDELPKLAAAALADPSAADAIADTMAAGLLNGMDESVEERKISNKE